MIVLYILLGILAFPLVILCLVGTLKLSIRAGYCENPLLILGIGPFKLKLADGKKREEPQKEAPPEPSKKKKPKKKKKKAEKEKKPKKQAKGQEQPPLTGVITSFRDLLFGLLRNFRRHLKIEELRLRVLVASDDAAKTALEYGAVCALAEPVHLLVLQAPRVRKDKVQVGVECDFLADKPEVDAEFCLSIRIWRLYWISLSSTKTLIRSLSLLKAFTAGAKVKKEEKKAKKQAKQEKKQKTVSTETDG